MMPGNDYKRSEVSGIVNTEYEKVFDPTKIREFYKDIERLPPAMSSYSPQKRTYYGSSFIKNELEGSKIAINSADVVVILGTSFNAEDDHLWDAIGNSSAKLLLCDPYPDLTVKSIQHKYGKSLEVIPSSFSECAEEISEKLQSMAG